MKNECHIYQRVKHSLKKDQSLLHTAKRFFFYLKKIRVLVSEFGHPHPMHTHYTSLGDSQLKQLPTPPLVQSQITLIHCTGQNLWPTHLRTPPPPYLHCTPTHTNPSNPQHPCRANICPPLCTWYLTHCTGVIVSVLNIHIKACGWLRQAWEKWKTIFHTAFVIRGTDKMTAQ